MEPRVHSACEFNSLGGRRAREARGLPRSSGIRTNKEREAGQKQKNENRKIKTRGWGGKGGGGKRGGVAHRAPASVRARGHNLPNPDGSVGPYIEATGGIPASYDDWPLGSRWSGDEVSLHGGVLDRCAIKHGRGRPGVKGGAGGGVVGGDTENHAIGGLNRKGGRAFAAGAEEKRTEIAP